MKSIITFVVLSIIFFNSSHAQISDQKLFIGYDNLLLTRGDKTASYYHIGYINNLAENLIISLNVGYGRTSNLFSDGRTDISGATLINYNGRLRSDIYIANLGAEINMFSFAYNSAYFILGSSLMKYKGVSVSHMSGINKGDGFYATKINLINQDDLVAGMYLGVKDDQNITDRIILQLRLMRSFYTKEYGNWHMGIGIVLKM